MTNKEAIEILNRDRDLCRFNPMTGERVPMSKDCEDSANALDVAISALEKQDGKRLSVNMIEVFDYNEGYCEKPEYHCSACGRIIVKKHNYCPKCGQRIDWSDEHGTD